MCFIVPHCLKVNEIRSLISEFLSSNYFLSSTESAAYKTGDLSADAASLKTPLWFTDEAEYRELNVKSNASDRAVRASDLCSAIMNECKDLIPRHAKYTPVIQYMGKILNPDQILEDLLTSDLVPTFEVSWSYLGPQSSTQPDLKEDFELGQEELVQETTKAIAL